MNASMLMFAAVLAAAALSAGGEPRRDSGQAAVGPTVELENERVTVIRLRMEPHQKIPMHDVTPRVVVWLTDATLRLTFPDGSTKEIHQRAGEAEWLPQQRHEGENLGDAPIELIAVVPKAR